MRLVLLAPGLFFFASLLPGGAQSPAAGSRRSTGNTATGADAGVLQPDPRYDYPQPQQRLAAADAALNAAYRATLARAPTAEARERLREAQRAWIALRDSHSALARGTGSAFPPAAAQAVLDTERRTAFLGSLVTGGRPGYGSAAAGSLAQADRELNDAYRSLLSAGGTAGNAELWRASQRAWVKSRDADLAVAAAYGKVASTEERESFLRNATTERTALLRRTMNPASATTTPTATGPVDATPPREPAAVMPPVDLGRARDGKWIPLPGYRGGAWSLAVEGKKRVPISADYVGMAGNAGYHLIRGDRSVLLTSAGREFPAGQLVELGRDHLGFCPQPGGPWGVVTSAGKVLQPPRLSYEEMNKLRDRGSAPADNAGGDAATTSASAALTAVEGAKSAVFNNAHPMAFPVAMDYHTGRGLLAVVQTIGSKEMGAEVRVWDVRSRCCVFSRRLPTAPESPVDVRLADNGLLFVSGGYAKHNTGYIEVYDLASHVRVRHLDVAITRLSQLLLVPLGDGREFVAGVPPVTPGETTAPAGGGNGNDSAGFFVIDSLSGRLIKTLRIPGQPQKPRSRTPRCVAGIAGQRAILIGFDDGEVAALGIDDGRLAVRHAANGVPVIAVNTTAATGAGARYSAAFEDGTFLTASWDGKPVIQQIPPSPGPGGRSKQPAMLSALTLLRDSPGAVLASFGETDLFQSYSNSGKTSRAPVALGFVKAGKSISFPTRCAADLGNGVLALGSGAGDGIVLFDAGSGRAIGPLGVGTADPAQRETFTSTWLDQPPQLRVNADGSQLWIRDRLFNLRALSFEAGREGKNFPSPVTDEDRAMRKNPASTPAPATTRPAKTDATAKPEPGAKMLDNLRLGPERLPAGVHLKTDPETVSRLLGLSPSGNVAAVWSQWKGSGILRLVDLARERVLTQTGDETGAVNLAEQWGLGFLKPLDDSGERLLMVRINGEVSIVDYANGRVTSTIRIPGEPVAAACAVEPKRLFVLTDDSTVHCVEWGDNLRLAMIGAVAFDEKNESFIAFVPGGYFTGTGPGGRLSLSLGASAIPLETAAYFLNRPDRVAAAFGADAEQVARLKRAQERYAERGGLASGALGDLPRIQFQNRAGIPLATEERTIALGVSATVTGGRRLSELRCFVNDVPVPVPAGTPFPARVGGEWSDTIRVELSRGSNKIQVSVLDEAGRESLRDTVTICHRSPGTGPRTLYVLAIGVSDYALDALDLGVASKDAQDFTRALQAGARGEFDAVQVRTVLDREATKENILSAAGFLGQAGVDDQTILFVAGHGVIDESDYTYWFGTTDIDPKDVSKRGLSYREIEGMFAGVKARERLLVMDTCFAGEVDADEMLRWTAGEKTAGKHVAIRGPAVGGVLQRPSDGVGELVRTYFSDLRRTTGANVLSASSGYEFVFAEERPEGDNGVFTYCLLEGLKGAADADRDGRIRCSELLDHAIRRVPEMTGGRQRPEARRANAELDPVVAAQAGR